MGQKGCEFYEWETFEIPHPDLFEVHLSKYAWLFCSPQAILGPIPNDAVAFEIDPNTKKYFFLVREEGSLVRKVGLGYQGHYEINYDERLEEVDIKFYYGPGGQRFVTQNFQFSRYPIKALHSRTAKQLSAVPK